MATTTTQTKTNYPLRKFRIKSGIHHENRWEDCGPEHEGEPDVVNVRGQLRRRVRVRHMPHDNPIVETHTDLVAKFGRKFEEIHDGQLTTVINRAPNRKLLEKMTVEQLKSFAAEHEPPMDLGGAQKKDEIVDAILINLGDT